MLSVANPAMPGSSGAAGAPHPAGWAGRPPVPPSPPWGWAAACLAFGWGAGSLFRLRQLTGINILDMFGFWCLVGAGLAAARFFTLLQAGEGRRRLLDALGQLGPGVLRLALPSDPRQRGRGGAELLVAGANRAWVVGTLDLSAAARPRTARKHLARAAERLVTEARSLAQSLAAAGLTWPEEPQAVLVLTRRPTGSPILEHGCWQVNPEHVAKLMADTEGVPAGGRMASRLAAWAQAVEAASRRRGRPRTGAGAAS